MNEKEFEKQQLEQLISDLKDIDKYTSFKNGAFIYDLGKYQGSLLINHINNLQSKIDKANELIKRKLSTETYQHLKKLYDDIDSTEEIWEDYEFEDLLDILKEAENVENN